MRTIADLSHFHTRNKRVLQNTSLLPFLSIDCTAYAKPFLNHELNLNGSRSIEQVADVLQIDLPAIRFNRKVQKCESKSAKACLLDEN